MTLQIYRFADPHAAAAALAEAIAADLRAALQSQPRALLLVSGGRSPIALLSAMAAQSLAWDRVDVSLVDERSVAPESDAANAVLVRQHLLTGAASAAHWIALMPPHLFASAADPMDAACQAAAAACADPALAHAAVIVLGVGADGHTASLFADSPQWEHARQSAERYVALQPGAAPHPRVGLSLQALRKQGKCYVWATGAEKSATLERLQQVRDEVRGRAGDLPAHEAESIARLAQAGPVACLIDDPAVQLQAYCSDRD
jgi:6-phosphogluconolactonase